MTKTIQRGFTLIELLVVIAIIGILAGVLFVAIDPSSQTTNASDASVKASLSGLPAAALIQYDTDSFSYVNACSVASTEIQALAGYNCNAAAGAFAVEASVSNSEFFCVDSTGNKTTNAATIGVATAC